MPSVTSCFLMRCGVRGRCPGAQASSNWPQLLITGPGTWRKPGRWGARTRGSLKEGPDGGSITAGLAKGLPLGNAWRQPGGRGQA